MCEKEMGEDNFGEGFFGGFVVIDFGGEGCMCVNIHEVSLSEAIPKSWESVAFSSLILRSCNLRILTMFR